MKIFFCLKTFLPDHVAGTEIYVASLAKGLMAEGHEVAVIKPNYLTTELTTYYYHGIKVLEYPESPLVTKDLIIGKKFPEGIAAFRDLLITENPDIIHFHEISGSNGITIQHFRVADELSIDVYTTLHLVRYVCKTSRLSFASKTVCNGVIDTNKCSACLLHDRGFELPLAYTLSRAGAFLKNAGVDLRGSKNKIASLLNYPGYIRHHKAELKEIFQVSKSVFVLNKWFEEILLNNGMPAEKITRLPRALPVEHLGTVESHRSRPASGKIKFVYVGRISKIKGLYFLLEALNSLPDKNWELHVYGNPTEHDYYQKCLKLTENKPEFKWKGLIDPSMVIETLKEYDMLLFPTMVQEMSPLITLEALAAGIPILASDVYANKEQIIEGENGWLYEMNNPDSLRSKLATILSKPGLIDEAKKKITASSEFKTVDIDHARIHSYIYFSNMERMRLASNLKVLHCLNHFLPGQTAGTEVYTWALSKGLQQYGIISDVAIPNYGQNETTSYAYQGITVHQFAEPSKVDRALQMGFSVPEGVPHFVKLVERLKPDIVHFHELAGSNGFTISHIEAVKAKGYNTIMTFHLAGYSCKSKSLMYKDEKLCDGVINDIRCSRCMVSTHTHTPELLVEPLLAAARILYRLNIDVSHYQSKLSTALGYPFVIKKLREDFHRLADSCTKLVVLTDWYKKILIRNGIPAEKILLNRQGLIQKAYDLPAEKKYSKPLKFIFVGRISHFKGVHLILDVFEKLPPEGFCLDLYGSDPEDDYSKSSLKRIEALSHVSWKGKIDPESVVDTMHKYDALILASTFSEMSPLVIQEAFAARIPVIASNVYGNAEQIVNGKNGWLFKFKDAGSLKNLLLALDASVLENIKAGLSEPRKFSAVVNDYVRLYYSMVPQNKFNSLHEQVYRP